MFPVSDFVRSGQRREHVPQENNNLKAFLPGQRSRPRSFQSLHLKRLPPSDFLDVFHSLRLGQFDKECRMTDEASKANDVRDERSNDWLVGGGEMGKVVRSMDWTKTPLGPLESWPPSLRTTVGLCLASNFPISLAWGPKHVQIYNDGYWPICGGKHPDSMGQDFSECWASAWPAIGESFERALAGQTSFLENQRMFLDRNGYLGETSFPFSFRP